MRIFKNRYFAHWASKLKIPDSVLKNAIDEMIRGLYEASLGGHIYKKRISAKGRGKRGGARTIIAFKLHDKAFFIYGYAKNKLESISGKEEEALKALAKLYFSYNDAETRKAIKAGELIEVQ